MMNKEIEYLESRLKDLLKDDYKEVKRKVNYLMMMYS